jgi:hypothetical protein
MVIIFEWPPSSELPLLNCHYFQNCHPERSEGSASAVAFAVAVALVFLSVIPVGNLLLLLSLLLFSWLSFRSAAKESASCSSRHKCQPAPPLEGARLQPCQKHLSGNGASAPEVRLTQPQGNTPRKL